MDTGQATRMDAVMGGLYYVQIKHDKCDDQKGGRTGKTRMSVGPFSHKEGIAQLKRLQEEHRSWHLLRVPAPLCIIRLEREPLDE